MAGIFLRCLARLVVFIAIVNAAPQSFADWQVHALRCTGDEIVGNCTSLDADVVEIESADGTSVAWPRSELVSLDSPSSPDPVRLPFPLDEVEPTGANGLILLPNDDRIVIASATPGESGLVVEHAASSQTLELPWESITYWMQTPVPASVSLITGQSPRADRLLLSNGDLISGELTQFSAAALRIDTAAGELTIGSERIAAVSFDPELVSLPALGDAWGVVQLTDGSRLTVTDVELQDAQLRVSLQWEAELLLPIEIVSSIHCYSDYVVSLSTLTPTRWEHQPYVPSRLENDDSTHESLPAADRLSLLSRANPAWNRSALGGPLRIRGSEFPRGIGMRPRSRLTFELAPESQYFRSSVGIDDRAAGHGSVVFRVETDGEVLWASPTLTGTEAPLDTGLIDLAGRQELTLIVDFATWGDLHDLADWGNPIVIRGRSND